MDQKEMQKFLAEHDFAAVVDATHPYAAVVTENIKESMKDSKIPYLRLKREVDEKTAMAEMVRSLHLRITNPVQKH